MGNRRVPTSYDGDDLPLSRSLNIGESRSQRKRKMVQLSDDEDDKGGKGLKQCERNVSEGSDDPEPHAGNECNEQEEKEEEDEEEVEAQPLGEVIRVSGRGRRTRKHYARFEYDGIEYELEDSVLLVPEDGSLKPYVAIIKDISQPREEGLMVTGQWFYRAEEAENKCGGHWQSSDTRELFYSFHRDEVPAESVMHKCVVHFIPQDKQIPNRKQHPGFFVQKVYDTEQRKLFKLTDKDYEDGKQHEIDVLVQKTLARLGDLPDLVPDGGFVDLEDHLKNDRILKKRKLIHVDVSRQDEGPDRSPLHKAETPVGASEHYSILSNFKVLTRETQRDKWLEKLLQSIYALKQKDDETEAENQDGRTDHKTGSHDKVTDHGASYGWPDEAVRAIAALEKAAHDTLPADQKYNQKMRQLTFNLKRNVSLTQRLLSGELEPTRILNMSPDELKKGLTAEETASREPEESRLMQMTNARCRRCNEKNVGLIEIIQAGNGYRYQLECVACGNTWYASRDDAAIIEEPTSGKPVETAPLAATKLENVQKKQQVNAGEAETRASSRPSKEN